MEKPFLFVDIRSPTWSAYVAFLVIAVFFRFTRVGTIRNLDLILLLLLSSTIVFYSVQREAAANHGSAPVMSSLLSDEKGEAEVSATKTEGTTAVSKEPSQAATVIEIATAEVLAQTETVGTPTDSSVDPQSDSGDGESADEQTAKGTEAVVWRNYNWGAMGLMSLTLLLLIRLIFDETLTRRPRLEQNLNQAGLTFLCIPAFAILMAGVLFLTPPGSTFKAMEHGRALLLRRDVPVNPKLDPDQQPAPTETLMAAGGAAVAQLSGGLPSSLQDDSQEAVNAEFLLARILVVIVHTTVVLGLLMIGKQHFASLQLGISMSCLYLLLPCTAVRVHELSHVLPAACLVWAIASYRNPIVSGVLLGLASGTLFFAAFLLPLWAVFYGRKGGVRFVLSVLGITVVLVTTLLLISGDANSFSNKLVTTANWTVYRLLDDSSTSNDASLSQLFIRIPMAAVFFVMLTAMTVLPRPRNLENLLANSTSLVVAAQMWYPDDIGTYVLWYLPLFLIVIFRPRLDRFTPPDIADRQVATLSPPAPLGATSTVAMSRLSFLNRLRRFSKL